VIRRTSSLKALDRPATAARYPSSEEELTVVSGTTGRGGYRALEGGSPTGSDVEREGSDSGRVEGSMLLDVGSRNNCGERSGENLMLVVVVARPVIVGEDWSLVGWRMMEEGGGSSEEEEEGVKVNFTEVDGSSLGRLRRSEDEAGAGKKVVFG